MALEIPAAYLVALSLPVWLLIEELMCRRAARRSTRTHEETLADSRAFPQAGRALKPVE
jgi:hypothetical protein